MVSGTQDLADAYYLIDLFQRSALGLRKEEKHPDCSDQARRKPDIPVSWSPVQGGGIYKVRRRKGGEPGSKKADCCCETEGVASEPLRGDLSAGQPSIRGNKPL